MTGLTGFRIKNLTRFILSSSFGMNTSFSSSNNFERLIFSYLILRSKACPSGEPYFYEDECYVKCP